MSAAHLLPILSLAGLVLDSSSVLSVHPDMWEVSEM